MTKISGWLWTDGHMIGDMSNWSTVYHWDGDFYETRDEATETGILIYGSDDFHVAHIVDDVVVWWGWMDEPHPINDARGFATQHKFGVGVTTEQADEVTR